MTRPEQYDKGFAAGMTAYRQSTLAELVRKLIAARYNTPYCKGYRAGAANAEMLDGRRQV